MNPSALNTRTILVGIGALVGALLVAIAGAAYSGADDYAARVHGHEISEEFFIEELEVLSTNEAVATVDPSFGDPGRGAVTAGAASNWLSNLIFHQVIIEIAEREDVTAGVTQRREQEQAFIEQFGGEKNWQTLPAWFRRRLVERNALQQAVFDHLGGAPTEAELRELYEARGTDLLQACTSIITLATAEEAAAVKAELDAGADFATVAAAKSIDPVAQQGGDVGCNPRGGLGVEPLDSEIFTVPLDVASGPIETQFGFHVIKVAKREVASFEEVRPELEQEAESGSQQRIQEEFLARLERAEITVNPKYCTFEIGIDGPACVPLVAPAPPDGLPAGGDETAPVEELPPGLIPTGP